MGTFLGKSYLRQLEQKPGSRPFAEETDILRKKLLTDILASEEMTLDRVLSKIALDITRTEKK